MTNVVARDFVGGPVCSVAQPFGRRDVQPGHYYLMLRAAVGVVDVGVDRIGAWFKLIINRHGFSIGPHGCGNFNETLQRRLRFKYSNKAYMQKRFCRPADNHDRLQQ